MASLLYGSRYKHSRKGYTLNPGGKVKNLNPEPNTLFGIIWQGGKLRIPMLWGRRYLKRGTGP